MAPTLLALTVVVLLAHALLLSGLPEPAGAGVRPGPVPLTVRQVTPAAAPRPEPPAAAAATRPSPRQAAQPPARPLREATDSMPVHPAAWPAAEPQQPGDGVAAAATEAMAAASEPEAAIADPGPAEPAPAGDVPPVYATRIPPAALLRYEMRRGALAGDGEMTWRPGPEGYELTIQGRAFGVPVLGWLSRGRFDDAGIAPDRFVDRRRGRGLRAASFQRDKGLITSSSSPLEHALLAGAQDRLSWIAQLAAVVEADPARFVAGEQVVMQVAGARGDADLWTFTVVAREPLELAGGRLDQALLLRREPRKPFDTRVEVWLDPSRHHLPARLRLTQAGGGDGLEFLLKP